MTHQFRRYNFNPLGGSVSDGTLITQDYQHDAFGRLRTSEPFTLFDYEHIMGDLNIYFENQTISGASISESSGSYLTMSVTDTSGSKAIRQSREYIPYQPGKSKLTYMTGVLVMDPTTTNKNVISRIGSFDDNNGIFFEFYEGTINLVERAFGIDKKVPRSSWKDPLNGTGSSGKNVSFYKAQIFSFDLEWLGVGQVRCGIVVDGIFRHCYTFERSGTNQIDAPYIKYAKLPVRYELISTGSVNTSRVMCGSIQSEGGYNPLGKSYIKPVQITEGLSLTDFRPLLSISLRNGTPTIDYNRGTIKIKGIEIIGTNAYFEYRVIRNGDISNVSGSTFNDFDTHNSITRYRTYSNGDTIDGDSGVLIMNGYVEKKASSLLITNPEELINTVPIVSDIAGTPDIATLAVRAISSTATTTINASLKWIELT